MSDKYTSNNIRIFRNTIYLYVRMLLLMLISLYTTRVVLKILGAEDFGIYNVVGSIVVMISVFNGALSGTTQRYICYELGKDGNILPEKVFAASLTLHWSLAVIILILAESIGLWFVNAKLNVPVERKDAMNVVYQFCIFSFLARILNIPYYAAIVAHEHMFFFSVLGIIEAILKLALAFCLTWINYDKLKLYGGLIFLISLFIYFAYYCYCRCFLRLYRFHFSFNKALLTAMLSFSGWYLLGSIALISMIQGCNILLNIFWGALVNTAMAVAFQLNGAVTAFVTNFRLAVDPQIVKCCASRDWNTMNSIVFNSAKLSYYLLLLLSLPLLFGMEDILKLWLGTVPEYTVLFCRLILIYSLVQSFDASFGIYFRAIGRIKENQILASFFYLMALPLSYFFFQLAFPPESVFYIQIGMAFIVAFIVKLVLLRIIGGIPLSNYFKVLIVPIVKVTLTAMILPLLCFIYFPGNIASTIVICFVSCFSVIISSFLVGINSIERQRILQLFSSKIKFFIYKEVN